MKYLLFTLEYPPTIGGVGNYYANLVKHWPDKDSIDVYDISKDKEIPKTNFKAWPKIVKRLNKKVKEDNINHIIVGHILPLGTATFLASFFSKFSYSVSLHGLDYSIATKKCYKKLLSFAILKRAKKIICANSFLAKKLLDDFPQFKDKLVISNPGAEVLAVDENVKKQLIDKYKLAGKKIIFSMGRLVQRKGFDYSILALSQLKKQNYDLYKNTIYLIAGTGPDEDNIKKLAKENEVLENTIFLGNLSPLGQEKFAFYSLCDVFLMPARQIDHDFEGFGIVYLEANLFKKPVVAGNSGGVSDAVSDNLNGLLIKPESISEIKEALEKILSNDKLANDLGEKGYLRAKEKFNWKYLAKNLKNNL